MKCCHDLNRLKNLEREAQKKFGWYIHIVDRGDDSCPYGFNAHTHNLRKILDHPDLQIVFPLPQDIVQPIFTNLVTMMKNENRRYTAGEVYYPHNGDKSYPITFINAIESGREVLRVILPDRYGKVLQDEFEDDRYIDQYII